MIKVAQRGSALSHTQHPIPHQCPLARLVKGSQQEKCKYLRRPGAEPAGGAHGRRREQADGRWRGEVGTCQHKAQSPRLGLLLGDFSNYRLPPTGDCQIISLGCNQHFLDEKRIKEKTQNRALHNRISHIRYCLLYMNVYTLMIPCNTVSQMLLKFYKYVSIPRVIMPHSVPMQEKPVFTPV